MDGLVLHFDAEHGNGLVRAGDGKRYPFDLSQWRSAYPPQNGDTVDFEIENGRASDVYVVRPTSQPSAGPAPATAANPSAQPDILLYLGRRPGLLPACFIVLSCFLPFISVPFFSVSLFGIVGYVSSALSMMSGYGGGPVGLRLAMWCLYLLYAIPGSAGWLIYREIRSEALPGLRVKVGVIGLVGPFAIYFLSALILVASTASTAGPSQFAGNPMGGAPGTGGPGVLSILSFIGIGWMLLAAASIALIAVGRGWSPMAKREADEAGMPSSDQPAFGVAPTAGAAVVASDDTTAMDHKPEAGDGSSGRTGILRNVTRGGKLVALLGLSMVALLFLVMVISSLRRAGGLSGAWEGQVTQDNPPMTYPMAMNLYGDVGNINYPTLACGGNLEFIGTDGTSFSYREHITLGVGRCTDGGIIQMRRRGPGTNADWDWHWAGSGYGGRSVVRGRDVVEH